MPCESYKPALTVAAAEKTAPSRELAAHLGACASCRAFFATERQLFAAVDSGVSAAANTQPPASLLPAVRVHLSEQRVRRSYWLPVAATIAGATLGVVVVLYRGNVRDRTGSDFGTGAAITTATKKSPSHPDPVPLEAPEKTVALPLRKVPVHHNDTVRQSPPSEVAVLVPSGQRQAFQRLLAGLQSGAVSADVLDVRKSEESSAGETLSPLAIAPIEIKPLTPVGEEAVPINQNSNR
jgi:hypothetical protein